MRKRTVAIAIAKAVAGLALIMAAFEFPKVTMFTLVFMFLGLLGANFSMNSVHYLVWNNFKPRLVSYQRLDRAPKFTIPKNSLLGQAISLVLQMLGYGLLLMLAVVAIGTGVANLVK